jgi:D-alanyl-D-alanine carboxypeptidase
MRTGFATLTVACGLFSWCATASAGPSIVIDASTGAILHAEQATDPWYPASLTKLMTAYVALRMVSEGKASLDTPLTVTAYAARQRPSKIGLSPGTEITLDNALKLMMVKSANDLAVTIAEGLGGSVEGFSALMNKEAQKLGMRESHFVNPNGWPDTRLSTSARDMALLGRALLMQFPQHRELWGIGAAQLGKRIFRNTNGLIGRYYGADGMKTGFVCASGFNVVASATRGGRTLITVILGAPSASERTAMAGALFDKGFSSFGGWGSGGDPSTLPVSSLSQPQDQRYYICGPGRRSRMPLGETEEFSLVPAANNTDNPLLDMMPAYAAANARRGSFASSRAMARSARAEFQPIQVFLGRAPGSDAAPRPAPVLVAAPEKPAETQKPAATAFAPPGQQQLPAAVQAATPIVNGLAGKPLKLHAAADEDKPKAVAKTKVKPAAVAKRKVKPDAVAKRTTKPDAVAKRTAKPEKAKPVVAAEAKPKAKQRAAR